MTGANDNPSYPFPQVNPSESVDSEGLKGSSSDQATRESTFNKKPDLSKGRNPEGNPSPFNPSCLTPVPSQPWRATWQRKLRAARTPRQRALTAWHALDSIARRNGMTDEAEAAVFEEVAAWLLQRAAAVEPPGPPPPTDEPRPVYDTHGRLLYVYDPAEMRRLAQEAADERTSP